MRLTINIDAKDLAAVQRITGTEKKSPAVGKAISLFLREMHKKRILRKVMQGKTDYRLSNAELEELGAHDFVFDLIRDTLNLRLQIRQI